MEQEQNKPLVIAVIITFVIAFWIGFAAGWLITGRKTGSPVLETGSEASNEEVIAAEEEETSVLSSSTPTNGIGNSIEVIDQLASINAAIASVTLTNEGWVVIHEDREGKPGNVLGAAWLPGGSHQNVTVDLLRAMEAGRRYYAILHHEVDGEGNHRFDLGKDLPLQNAEGKIITVSFETISSPR